MKDCMYIVFDKRNSGRLLSTHKFYALESTAKGVATLKNKYNPDKNYYSVKKVQIHME